MSPYVPVIPGLSLSPSCPCSSHVQAVSPLLLGPLCLEMPFLLCLYNVFILCFQIQLKWHLKDQNELLFPPISCSIFYLCYHIVVYVSCTQLWNQVLLLCHIFFILSTLEWLVPSSRYLVDVNCKTFNISLLFCTTWVFSRIMKCILC